MGPPDQNFQVEMDAMTTTHATPSGAGPRPGSRLPLVLLLLVGGMGSGALAPAPLTAQGGPLLSAEAQVRLAVQGLPNEFQASATVLGYRALGGALVELRRGAGAYICLADDPTDARFHAPCYHKDLEPFMKRGREIRAAGQGDRVDEIRYAEIEAGTLPMPKMAALYALNARPGDWDPTTGEIRVPSKTLVIYVPGATAESTGLSLQPKTGEPWLMSPGTPKAHIMFTETMGG